MKKLLLTLAVLLGLSGVAGAVPLTSVMDTIGSSVTCVGMDISSQTATDLTDGTAAVQVWKQVCVQNLDASNYLAVSENVAVATTTTNAAIGTILRAAPTATTPDPPTCFSILAGSPYYARTSKTTGTTRAGVCRGR